jgi:hypothetical protein
MSVKIPVRIYAGMPVGQLIYFEISGRVDRSYSHKRSAKYRKVSPHPMPSRMHLNFRTRRPARAARKPAGEARDAAYAPGAGRPTK